MMARALFLLDVLLFFLLPVYLSTCLIIWHMEGECRRSK